VQTPTSEALFRFQVVSEVRARVLRGEALAQAALAVSKLEHFSGEERSQRVSLRTIYRWLKAYDGVHLWSLEPEPRPKIVSSLVLSERLQNFLAAEKNEDIRTSLPEILRRARLKGIIGQEEKVDRSTVYRACVRLKIPVVRSYGATVRDSRRFAYPHRMDLVLSDGKHFRAGAKRAKRVAMFFLDDCTRFGLHCVVGPSESKALFLRGLYGSIQLQGIAKIYYLDHGAGFIAHDTTAVIQQLPALLIHGEKAYPQGHGKIERFHLTLIEAVLRNLDGRADIDSSCSALELRLNHWLHETYNHTPHESLEQKKSPFTCFTQDQKPLHLPESGEKLRESFKVHMRRKVSKDHIVPFKSVHYEVPRGLAGQWVNLYRQVLDGSIQLLHEGKLILLHPVDLASNAKTHRGKIKNLIQNEAPSRPPTPSAADLAFARDFQPIVDPDGGFPRPLSPDSEGVLSHESFP